MSIQQCDKLFYEGNSFDIIIPIRFPLDHKCIKEKKSFFNFNTSISRGYIATWKINDNKLYLVDFKNHESKYENICNEKIFASWVSDDIQCILKSKDMEERHILTFENGTLKNTQIKEGNERFFQQ